MITLTNGVQIPENAVQLQTTAAIDGYYVTQPLRLVQYDETLPVAAVQLTYQNQPYAPPTGAELNVRMGKPDGTTVYNPCLGMDSSGIVYFAFTQQMTIVAGTGTLTVEITDSGVKNSAPIIAEIRPNPVPEGSIESADEFLTLQEILAEAEKWGQIVQTNATNIQQVVDNLADIQNAAENAQAAAASAAAAQKAAQEALGFRKFYSAVVPDANGNLDPSRPMTVGPAASVEIESAGDRIQSVTALGFTQQAGTGDPSSTNVRALTNGGLRMYKLVIDGSQSIAKDTSVGGTVYYNVNVTCPANVDGTSVAGYSKQYCNRAQIKNADGQTQGDYAWVYGENLCRIAFFSRPWITTAEAMQADLAADPLIIWYIPADESQATGLYAPIRIQGGEYRATCLPLTAPLCEGDSVVSWAKSGCDQQLTLDGSTLTVAASGSNYTVVAANAVAGGTVYASGLAGLSLTAGSITIPGTAFPSSVTNAGQANTWLQSNPQTLYYQSTGYTEADDKPVSLETHQQAVLVLDGTESWATMAEANQFGISIVNLKNSNTLHCTHYKPVKTAWSAVPDKACNGTAGQIAIHDSDLETVDGFKQYLAAQYAAGTPVTIVYELATPITYAHPAVVLEAATGDQPTYTVTGQSGGTVSVALKPFQDGGRAKTADSAANAQNAVNAQTANNSQQLGGLTLSALQNRLVPVGYIFSWAPASGGPDLSTAQKVAAYFGFGTWQAYGNGQVLVGLDAGQTEFATVGKTGGEKTHKMTTSEMPRHKHGVMWSSEGGTGSGSGVLVRDALSGGPWPYSYQTGADGGDQPHNNLQPYITVYRWQRVK